MVGKFYHDEFFTHVPDRSVLQKSERLMTSLQFVIRPLISKLLKSLKVSIAIHSMLF